MVSLLKSICIPIVMLWAMMVWAEEDPVEYRFGLDDYVIEGVWPATHEPGSLVFCQTGNWGLAGSRVVRCKTRDRRTSRS